MVELRNNLSTGVKPMADNDQILMVLGELKGQMSSIQGYIAVQSDRMDRQDVRMDQLESKLDAHNVKMDNENAKQNERIDETRMKMAKWGGIGAVLLFLAPYVIKILFPSLK